MKRNTWVSPKKCYSKSNYKTYIGSYEENTCYFTKCPNGEYSDIKRKGYCKNFNDADDVLFLKHASFEKNSLSSGTVRDFCDLDTVTENHSYIISDIKKYEMYCDINGIWRYPNVITKSGIGDKYSQNYGMHKIGIFAPRPGYSYSCVPDNHYCWQMN